MYIPWCFCTETLKAIRSLGPFEAGIEAIVSGETSQAGTAEIIRRIVWRYGTPVAGLSAFGLSHTFPLLRRWPGQTLASSASAHPADGPSALSHERSAKAR